MVEIDGLEKTVVNCILHDIIFSEEFLKGKYYCTVFNKESEGGCFYLGDKSVKLNGKDFFECIYDRGEL